MRSSEEGTLSASQRVDAARKPEFVYVAGMARANFSREFESQMNTAREQRGRYKQK